MVTDEPFVFPSLGPTAFLLLERADSPAASPRNTIAGHAIGVAAGFVALAVFGLVDAPSALEVGVSLSRAMAAGLSLGATSSLMILLRRVHPPAGATTLIVSLGLMRTARELAVLLSAVVLLVSLSQLSRRLHTTSRRRAERRRRSRSRGRCR
ncbi:MAG: HPP family protein [Myxococcales bacterium]|nr:HPP family protein [Myxococcales bacterium]